MVSEKHILAMCGSAERVRDRVWEAKAFLSPEKWSQLGNKRISVMLAVVCKKHPLDNYFPLPSFCAPQATF